MVKPRHMVIAGCVVAAGVLAFFVFWQSEEAKVKKRFAFIGEKIEKSPPENKLISAAKANRILEAFTETVGVRAPAYDFSREISSDEMTPLVLNVRSRYSEISLKFHDFVIDFPEKGTAQVAVTATMEGKLTTGETVEDLHELKCGLLKTEDVWRLNEIEVVEVLKK